MRWRVLVALAVVLTAGCGSLFAAGDETDGSATDSLTPAPVPEVTPTPERCGIAPGLTVSTVRLDGRPHYLVVGRNWPDFTGETVHNGTVTAVVSPEGFVRSLEAVYTVRSVGQPRRVRYGFTYEQVDNTTVEAPDWYDGEN